MFNIVQDLPILPHLDSETTDKGRFYTLLNGKKVPSVTTILGHFEKESLDKWRERVGQSEARKVGFYAKERGTVLHENIEKFILNKEIPRMMPNVRQLFVKIRRLLEECLTDVYYTESTIYSERLEIAGRLDLVAKYNGKLSIIDFKTSEKIKTIDQISHYLEQLVAYDLMLEEATHTKIIPEQLVCIIANEEWKQPQVFILDREHPHYLLQYLDSLLKKVETYKRENNA